MQHLQIVPACLVLTYLLTRKAMWLWMLGAYVVFVLMVGQLVYYAFAADMYARHASYQEALANPRSVQGFDSMSV